jgi:hypothetical protein
VVVLLLPAPADLVFIDVYDSINRTVTKLSINGPLAGLIAERCIDTIGHTVVAGQLTGHELRSNLEFVPTGYEDIYRENMERRHQDGLPRSWVLEADPTLAETYRSNHEQRFAELGIPPDSADADGSPED